jgi:hypothetical protein
LRVNQIQINQYKTLLLKLKTQKMGLKADWHSTKELANWKTSQETYPEHSRKRQRNGKYEKDRLEVI